MRSGRHMLRIVSALLLSGAVSMPVSAFAACTQDRAIYSDDANNFTLTFRPEQPSDLQLTPKPTNEFTITSNDTPAYKLTGLVIWPEEGVTRPTALVMYNCTGDGSNTEDLDDCSIWQGVVYALKEGAEAGLLPKAAEPAAQAVLFPDLIGALETYDFGAATPAKPLEWEAFRFKQCATPEE